MKLNTQSQKTIKTNFEGRGADLTIDAEDVGLVLGFLSDGIYSNGIGSIVREYVSNAYDAHQEEGTSDPVEVIISTDNIGTYFAVRDFGCGMGEEEIDLYFKKYGKSSKRDTNEQLGAFGLGSKSFQAYTDAVYYTTVKNGVERAFALFKSNNAPRYEPIHEVRTDERNGTIVKIYIKSSDSWDFQRECLTQLRYFDNIFYNFRNFQVNANDYQIVEANKFMYSSQRTADGYTRPDMHIVLGKVAYPIDFDKFSYAYQVRNIPIGLKFEIGELPVTVSREEIKYTPQTIKLIEQRIHDVIGELIQLYNEQNSSHESIVDFILATGDRNSRYGVGRKITLAEGHILNATEVINWAVDEGKWDVKPLKIKGYGDIDFCKFRGSHLEELLWESVKPRRYISDTSARNTKVPEHPNYSNNGDIVDWSRIYTMLESDKTAIYIKQEESWNSDVNKYLADHHRTPIALIESFKNSITWGRMFNTDVLKSLMLIKKHQSLNPDDEEVLLEQCKEVAERMRQDIFNHYNKYEDVKVDPELIPSLRALFSSSASKATVDRTKLNVYLIKNSERRYADEPVFQNDKFTVDAFDNNFDGMNYILYGIKGVDDIAIKQLWNDNYARRNKFGIFLASNRVVESIISLSSHKFMSVEEFYDSAWFKEQVDLKLKSELVSRQLTDVNQRSLDIIDKVLDTNLTDSYKYLKKYYVGRVPKTERATMVYRTMYEEQIAEDKYKLPKNILEKCLEIQEIFSNLSFIQWFSRYEDVTKISSVSDAIKDLVECREINLDNFKND